MISNEEKDRIRKILPELIRSDPTIRGELIGLLEGVLATKEDFKEFIKSQDKRFEAMASKDDLQQLIKTMDKRFEAMVKEIKEIRIGLGSLGNRSGQGMEKVIVELAKEIISHDLGLDIKKIRQLIIIDVDGALYHKGAEVEYDLFMDNNTPLLFEIKFNPEKEDLYTFKAKAKFFEKVKKQQPKLYLIAICLPEEVRIEAARLGIDIIGQTSEKPEVVMGKTEQV